jgi:hypothetical protein
LEYANTISQKTIVGKILKCSKGHWLSGENNDEVPVDTVFVVNFDAGVVAWVNWSDNKPI